MPPPLASPSAPAEVPPAAAERAPAHSDPNVRAELKAAYRAGKSADELEKLARERGVIVSGDWLAGMRRHVVVKGDTLFSLAQKYYGNRSRWRDIYAANRDLLPDENSLRLGMEIRLP